MLNKMLLLLLININIFAASFEIGGIMGRPIGFSSSCKFGSNSIDLNFGLISYNNEIKKNGQTTEETAWGKYIDVSYMFLTTPNEKLKVFNFAIGLGGVFYKTDDIHFGAKLPLQLLFFIKEAKINLFLELAPAMILYEKSGFTLLGGLGARYVFGGETKKQTYRKNKKNYNNNYNNNNNKNKNNNDIKIENTNTNDKNNTETKDVKTDEKKDTTQTTDENKTNTKDDSKTNTKKIKNHKNSKNKNSKTTDKNDTNTEETNDVKEDDETEIKKDNKEVNHEITKVKIKTENKDDKKDNKEEDTKDDDKKDDKKKDPKGVDVPW